MLQKLSSNQKKISRLSPSDCKYTCVSGPHQWTLLTVKTDPSERFDVKPVQYEIYSSRRTTYHILWAGPANRLFIYGRSKSGSFQM